MLRAVDRLSHSHRITLKIAEIVFAIDVASGIVLDLDDVWQRFQCAEDPDITIEISEKPVPESGLGDERVFQSENLWAIFAGNNSYSLATFHPYSPLEIQRLIVSERDFRRARFFFRQSHRVKAVNPLDYPLGQIFMVCVLARSQGLMVHASGVDDHGHGYLFAGHSGQGKSTLSSLWEGHGRVLNDDRVIIRRLEDGYYIYPTPWHGTYPNVSVRGVALEKVLLVSHGSENSVRRKTGAEALCGLLARSFPPLWEADGMASSINLLNHLIQEIPCYEMAFFPDAAIIDLVRCAR